MKRLFLLLVALFASVHLLRADEVVIDSVRYSIADGVHARVIKYKPDNGSSYTNAVYVIPSTIIYKDLSYIVNEIVSYAFSSSNLKKIRLPDSLEEVGEDAFRNCKNLVSVVFPPKLKSLYYDEYYKYGVFHGCDILRYIVFLSQTPPADWEKQGHAATTLYVADIQAYARENGSAKRKIVPVLSFSQDKFVYTGKPIPFPDWTCNIEGATVLSVTPPELPTQIGLNRVSVPITFEYDGFTYSAEIAYYYEVLPAPLTVSIDPVAREYGDENPAFPIHVTGLLAGEDEREISWSLNPRSPATRTSSVGNYPILLDTTSLDYYRVNYEPGVLTVRPAPLTAKITDVSKTYGARVSLSEARIEYTGLKNDETAPQWKTAPRLSTEASQFSDVGDYPIVATEAEAMNYNLQSIEKGVLKVEPATLDLYVSDAQRRYYEADPQFSYRVSGFVSGIDRPDFTAEPTLAAEAIVSSGAGEYPIVASGAAMKNYTIRYHQGTLTITKRSLSVACPDYTRTYGMENPQFSLVYSGFVNNEDTNALKIRPLARCQATPASSVGHYTISVSGGEALNYSFTYTNGTLSVTKASQTLSWEQDFYNVQVGDQIALTAETSSGLPVNYELSPSGMASIYYSGDAAILDCQHAGSIMLKASQDGNQNYSSAVRITKNIVIFGSDDPADMISVTVQSNNMEQGTASITGSGTYRKGERVTITATPKDGYRFVNWTRKDGSVFSTGAVYSFTVMENLELTANFEERPADVETFTVVLTANNNAYGRVSHTGNGTYEEAESITITATAHAGYRFVNWTRKDGSLFSRESVYTFAVTENLELTANFEKIPETQTFTVSLSANNPEWGVVSLVGNDVCAEGEEVTIVATPKGGYRFTNWTRKDGGVFSSEAIYTFAVTENLELTANFEKLPDVGNESHGDDDFYVYVQDHTIHLSADRGVVQVYSATGVCVYSGYATVIPVKSSGLYIVRAGERAYKVIVR